MYIILHTYGYGFICFGYLFTIILFFYASCLFKGFYLLFPKALLIYIIYFLFLRVICADSFFYKIAPSTTSMFVFLGFFLFYLKDVNISDFLRIYRWIVYANIVFLVVQEVMFYSVGYRIPGVFSFLPLTLGSGDFDPSVLAEMPRSSAMFSEPSHFVQFLLPLIPIEIFYVASKKAYFRASIFVLILLLLQSGNAFLGLGVLIVFIIYYLLRKVKVIYSVIILPSILLMMIGGGAFLLGTEQGEKILDRKNELGSNNDSYISSGFIRIYRGYFVFKEMSPFEKIIGLNDKNKIIRTVEKSEVSFAFGEGDLYFNGVQGFLIHNGLLGLALFSFFIIWLWRGNNLVGRCVLMMLCSLSFIASLFFTHTMLLYLVIVFIMKWHTKKCAYKLLKLSWFR